MATDYHWWLFEWVQTTIMLLGDMYLEDLFVGCTILLQHCCQMLLRSQRRTVVQWTVRNGAAV
jgi:hypothetical protein